MNSSVSLCLSIVGLLSVVKGHAANRIRDLTYVLGAHPNQVVGIGVVHGLANGGDSDTVRTRGFLTNQLKRLGITLSEQSVSSSNAAVVRVSAMIPPYARSGQRTDVTVTAMADAKSLEGGMLAQTPLMGADGLVYAVAQGPIAASNRDQRVEPSRAATGEIIQGAIVQRGVATSIVSGDSIYLVARDSDSATASRLVKAIDATFQNSSQAVDERMVRVRIPDSYRTSPIDFVAQLQGIEVALEIPARVLIIDERTGLIIVTGRTRIQDAADSNRKITARITEVIEGESFDKHVELKALPDLPALPK